VIAAVKSDPRELIEEGKLREDLYYRISALQIDLPPLFDRKEIIPQLAELLLAQVKIKFGLDVVRISPEAKAKLKEYDYPGNIRELHNILILAAALADEKEITPKHIEFPLLYTSLKTVSRGQLLEALSVNHGNIAQAAAYIGLKRTTFYSKMERHKIGRDYVKACRKLSYNVEP